MGGTPYFLRRAPGDSPASFRPRMGTCWLSALTSCSRFASHWDQEAAGGCVLAVAGAAVGAFAAEEERGRPRLRVLCSPEDGGVLSVCGLCVAPVRPPLSVSLAARCPIVMHLAECHMSLSRPTRHPSTPPSGERAVSPPLLVNAVLLAQSARRQRVSASCSRASAWMPRDSSARRRRVNSAR